MLRLGPEAALINETLDELATMTRAERRRAVARLQRQVLDQRGVPLPPAKANPPRGRGTGARGSRATPAPSAALAAPSAPEPIDRRELEPGLPSMASGIEGYKVDDKGVVKRPAYATPQNNTAIDAALDFNPDANHAAWVAKRLGLTRWELGVWKAGTEDDPEADPDARLDAVAFLSRVFGAYSGGGSWQATIDAMLEVGLDGVLRRGAVAAELDVADSRDDVLDVDFVDATVVDFQTVVDGRHRRVVPIYQPQSGGPRPLNLNTFCYLGINKRAGQPHGASPFLPLVDTTFPQSKLRDTLEKVAANQGWARILLILKWTETALAAGPDVVRPTEGGGFEVLDPLKFQQHMDKARKDLAAQAKTMYADDTWVVYDAVKPDSLGANHGQQSLRTGEVAQLFDTDQIMAVHGQPTIWGRNWGAALSTTGDVQWMVYALGLEALRTIPARVVEFVLNQFFRIRGIAAYATLTYPDIRKEDRKAEAEAEQIEVNTAVTLRDAGAIDDDEMAQRTVGHEATGTRADPAPARQPAASNAAPGPGELADPAVDAGGGEGGTEKGPHFIRSEDLLPRQNGNGHHHDPYATHPEFTEPLWQRLADAFVPDSTDVAGEVELAGSAALDDTDAERQERAWARWCRGVGLTSWATILGAVGATQAEADAENSLWRGLANPSEWKRDRYQWDADKARFRYPPREDGKLGRLVPDTYVRNLFERRLADAEQEAAELARRLTANDLTPRQFQGRMKDLLAEAHLQARMLAVGGRAQMGRADYEHTGDLWRQDVRFMARFTQAIANGEAGTPAQIVQRARQYAAANIRNEYEQGRARADLAAGMNEETWERQAGSDSCADCIDLAGRGWVPFGTLPQVGTNACRSGCNCRIRRRRRVEEGAPA